MVYLYLKAVLLNLFLFFMLIMQIIFEWIHNNYFISCFIHLYLHFFTSIITISIDFLFIKYAFYLESKLHIFIYIPFILHFLFENNPLDNFLSIQYRIIQKVIFHYFMDFMVKDYFIFIYFLIHYNHCSKQH